jgi:hypothetical protein
VVPQQRWVQMALAQRRGVAMRRRCLLATVSGAKLEARSRGTLSPGAGAVLLPPGREVWSVVRTLGDIADRRWHPALVVNRESAVPLAAA